MTHNDGAGQSESMTQIMEDIDIAACVWERGSLPAIRDLSYHLALILGKSSTAASTATAGAHSGTGGKAAPAPAPAGGSLLSEVTRLWNLDVVPFTEFLSRIDPATGRAAERKIFLSKDGAHLPPFAKKILAKMLELPTDGGSESGGTAGPSSSSSSSSSSSALACLTHAQRRGCLLAAVGADTPECVANLESWAVTLPNGFQDPKVMGVLCLRWLAKNFPMKKAEVIALAAQIACVAEDPDFVDPAAGPSTDSPWRVGCECKELPEVRADVALISKRRSLVAAQWMAVQCDVHKLADVLMMAGAPGLFADVAVGVMDGLVAHTLLAQAGKSCDHFGEVDEIRDIVAVVLAGIKLRKPAVESAFDSPVRYHGIVVKWEDGKQFGFIRYQRPDFTEARYYVHAEQVMQANPLMADDRSQPPLNVGDQVTFELGRLDGDHGNAPAVEVMYAPQ